MASRSRGKGALILRPFDSSEAPDAVESPLDAVFRPLRTAFDREGGLDVPRRRERLRALRAHLVRSATDYVEAVEADFGIRSRYETLLAEVSMVIGAIDHALPRLARWSSTQRVGLRFPVWPARAHIRKEPRGVVAIIGPFNYPIHLMLVPFVGALAAGCRILLKPSEATPRVADCLRTGLHAIFDPDEVRLVTGDAVLGAALTRLPLDLILFTGSGEVGGHVLRAAAERKTPVVLELGGKSPVVLDETADLATAATSIIAGKMFNAGQTCVAPDYCLVPAAKKDAAIEALRAAAARLYPDARDMTGLLLPGAAARLHRLIVALETKALLDFDVVPPLFAPALVVSPPLDSAIMREEIFGPLLPIITYETIDDAIAIIRDRPHPLALYWFGKANARLDRLLARTVSGSVSLNETVLHAGVHELPFGGIGASGLGRYHGKAGFDTFTHERPVFEQARFSFTGMMRPPYGKLADRILRGLIK